MSTTVVLLYGEDKVPLSMSLDIYDDRSLDAFIKIFSDSDHVRHLEVHKSTKLVEVIKKANV